MVLPPLNGLSLCSGGGGLDMGLGLAEPGFHTRCWVEWEDYPRQTLIAGMQAGYLAPAPIWDNVKTFDAKPFAGAFDTIVAGYPCQPFSMAGQRKGEDDERHLWPDIERHIEDLGPQLRWCFFENVSGHLSLGLDTVLDALRRLGFTTAVGVFSAEEVGATHERQRVFIVAYRDCERGQKRTRGSDSISDPQKAAGVCPEACRSSGGIGVEPELADTPSFGVGVHARSRPEGGGTPEPRGRGAELDDTTSARCDDARIGADTQQQGGERLSGAGCGELADTGSSSGHEGGASECGGGVGPRGTRETAFAGGSNTPLFPPAPSDSAGWASALRVAPDLAPSTSFGDIARRAGELAALVASGELEEAQAEPALCRMVDGLAQRSRALRLLGNGVCPLAAAYAWRTLSVAHRLGWVDLGKTEYFELGQAPAIGI